MGYTHPDAVFTAPSGVKIDPYDPTFSARSGCRGCGDPKDHDGRAGQRLACVSMAWERTWAIDWLAGATGMPVAEAERAVDAMRRTAGIRAGVRALDALLDLGWRPGGGW